MIPLIDGDILKYEIGFAAEAGWQGEGTPPFDYVEELLVLRIEEIIRGSGADQPPIIFLSGEGNFREGIAVTKPYKGNRGDDKRPFHYANIEAYIKSCFDFYTSTGIESDDAMCIRQFSSIRNSERDGTIICTRDKDLRMCPGWHFGWELGRQPQFGPEFVRCMGRMELKEKNKLIATGLRLFYAQCLTGDIVDNIPGLSKYGPKKAYSLLMECDDELELFTVVSEEYKKVVGEKWKEYLLEQGRLLWMVRELHEDGSPVMWEFPIND